MICEKCGCDPNEKMINTVKKYKVPFYCELCGSVYIKHQAVNGINFIWPEVLPEKHGGIYIPDKIKPIFKKSIGIVLSSGIGCINKQTRSFIRSVLKPGDIVLYDKSVPWQLEFEATDGKKYQVDMCNIIDICAYGE